MSAIYDFSIPVFIRALKNLEKFTKIGEKWCVDNNNPYSLLLEARLAEDMKPFPWQILNACNIAINTVNYVGCGPERAPEYEQNTFPELYARIDQTLEILQEAKPEAFKDPDAQVIVKFPKWTADMPAIRIVQRLVLPNFFFHESMAYALLRHKGVPLDKLDYLDVWTMADS